MNFDQIQLRFDSGSLALLNVILALITFGVALDITVDDFRRVARSPKGPVIGLVAQFVLLPAGTFLLTRLIGPAPSIALGMIMVASSPGGNLSNFITQLAGGNLALSVSISALTSVAGVVMMPMNLAFWGSLHPETAALMRQVALDPKELFLGVFLVLGVPLALGMGFAHRFPRAAARLRKPFRALALSFFVLFVGLAFKANFDHFMNHIGRVFFVVLAHNACALAIGYFAARALRLPERDARAVSIEVGIQNSGLALALVFNFFGGLGGMALVAAWWGIWHLISGLTMAFFWSRRRGETPLPATLEVAS